MIAARLKAYLEQAIHAHPACRHVRIEIAVHRPQTRTTGSWSIHARILGTRGPVDPEACEDAISAIVARAQETFSAAEPEGR